MKTATIIRLQHASSVVPHVVLFDEKADSRERQEATYLHDAKELFNLLYKVVPSGTYEELVSLICAKEGLRKR